MPNVAIILKTEIARVARKEARGETEALKKASSQYRSEISSLKKRLGSLEALLARLAKQSSKKPAQLDAQPMDQKFRFSAKGLASQRKRLGMSASDCGVLLNASGQTIYKWETGEARPRAKHMPAIAAFRGLGRKQALQLLDSLRPPADGKA